MTDTYSEIGVYRPSIPKDPDAALEYTFDWTDWLAEVSDTIDSYTLTVSGVTKTSDARVGARVTVWVSGGTVNALAAPASIACRIVTAGGRTEDRTIYLLIRER